MASPEVLSWLPAGKVEQGAVVREPVEARPRVTVRVRVAGVVEPQEYEGDAHAWQAAPAAPAVLVEFRIGALSYFGWLPADLVTRR